ncbi:response regulator [Stutzerimonas tarimensis]|uniref:histidine kinase n=1 Tax=Stutzerimonas tarimensis TaxID=1507735 RepID=A0ABV7TDK7_9GAMM
MTTGLLVVAPAVRPGCSQAVQIWTLLTAEGQLCELIDEQALLVRLGEASADGPDVLILAPSIVRPVVLARAVRQRWPNSELLFVRDRGAMEAFRRSLGVAPLLGAYWSITELDPATLCARVARAEAEVKRRKRFRSTLDQANRNMAQRAEAPTRRAQVADYYLSSFINSVQEALVGIDLEGQVLFWSLGARELFGLDEKRVFGRSIRTLPFWSDELEALLDALGEQGESQLLEVSCDINECPMVLELLVSVVCNHQGEQVGISLLIRDITAMAAQRAASEAQVRAEQQHLYRLFHQAPGFVAVTRGAEHRVELANRAFRQLTGHREVLARPFDQLFPHHEGQTIARLLERVRTSRRPFVGRGTPLWVKRARDQEAQLRYVDFVFQPVISEQGVVTGIFCQGHDVTLQKRAQEQLQRSEENLQTLVEERTHELERSQQALLHSQKLEAIGKLTGGVAHDFNNVLQIIGANLQLMRAALPGDAPLLDRVEAATAAVERGSKLSSQLLAFARRQPLNPAPVNLASLLHNMDDLLRRALRDDIELRTRVEDGLWTTLVDPNQLENVVLNLAINARDAMASGGLLSLELANAVLGETFADALPEVGAGEYVMLAVSDTGCGMDAETLERAFEPFFSTKPEGQGTGLGLSMAYGFIRQSGGHIRLYSEPGSGTTIKLYLPRTALEEVVPPRQLAGPVVGGRETILVVEDDPAVQATVIDQLSGLGYQVLRASDARGALTILESGLAVDLLFTDVVMPGPMRAPELAREAVRLLPEIVVLFTSGYTQNAIVHGGRLDEGVELISKPYRLEDLARRIRHLLSSRESRPGAAAKVVESAASPTVLVVEDQPSLLELTCEMLQLLEYQTVGVASAEQALALLEQRSFDLLLTDVGLPGMSGLDLLAEVRQRWPGQETIIVSGYGDGLGEIAARVLPKPFSFEQLEALLPSRPAD